MMRGRPFWGIVLTIFAVGAANFIPFAFRDFPWMWPPQMLAVAMKRGLLHPLDQRGWMLLVIGSWIAWSTLFTLTYAGFSRTKTPLEGAGFGLLVGLLVAVPHALTEIGVYNIPASLCLLQAGVTLPVTILDGVLAAIILRATAGTLNRG